MARALQPSFYLWAKQLPESDGVRWLHARGREVFADLGGLDVEAAIADYKAVVARWRSGGDGVGLREALRCLGAIDRGNMRRELLRERAWLHARTELFRRTGERIPLPQTPEEADRQQSAEESEIVRDLSAQIRALGAMSDELVASNVFAGVAGSETGQELRSRSGEPVSGSLSGGRMPVEVPDPLGADSAKGSGQGSRSGSGNGSDTSAPQPVFQYAEGPQDEPPTNKQVKLGVQRLIAARVDRPVVLQLRELGKSGRITRAKWNDSMHKLLTA